MDTGVLVASSAPLDQYLAREPAYFLGSPIEEARVDPDNVEILVQHLKCAAFEMPFQRGEAFGSLGAEETAQALGFLERHRVLHQSSGDTYHWAADAYPANDVSLRTVGWDNVVIIDVEHDRSIAELDWESAQTMLHEQAIYQHDGECWQVERFDHENHKAFVRRVEPDYWTSAMTYVEVRVLEESARGAIVQSAWQSGWGEVAVVEKVVGYKKIKFYTHENAGYGDVRLPEMQMHTTAFWLTVPEEVSSRLPEGRAAAIDGLRGVGLALETVSTLALMCDPRDLGTTLGDAGEEAGGDAPAVPRKVRGGLAEGYAPTLFLYEHDAGRTGSGRAEGIWDAARRAPRAGASRRSRAALIPSRMPLVRRAGRGTAKARGGEPASGRGARVLGVVLLGACRPRDATPFWNGLQGSRRRWPRR